MDIRVRRDAAPPIEVTMIDGINDRAEDSAALASLLRGSGAHVNLIPMNAVAHTPWQESKPERIEQIANQLRAAWAHRHRAPQSRSRGWRRMWPARR